MEKGTKQAKEKCEEEMKKQPAPRRSGRLSKVKDERPNTKEKCDKEEEMKKQPDRGRKRRHSNDDERPNMSGCEGSAEEKTGETEEQEPAAQAPISINPPPRSVFQLSLSRSPQAPVLINLSLHETMRLYFSLHETMQRYFSLPTAHELPASPSPQAPVLINLSPLNEVAVYSLQTPEPRNRAEFLKYSCQPSLDPNTAHRELRLSEGNRKVTRGETQQYPDHPERFDRRAQVLCREGLSGTRCYWEVEWSGGWTSIGVTYKGISRKGEGNSCCLGYNDKSWSLFCSDSSYTAMHNNNHTAVTAPRSPRIGVYLDFNAGTLSFYDVSDTMTLLHRFQTTFNESLYPGFELWRSNSTVIICQLN